MLHRQRLHQIHPVRRSLITFTSECRLWEDKVCEKLKILLPPFAGTYLRNFSRWFATLAIIPIKVVGCGENMASLGREKANHFLKMANYLYFFKFCTILFDS